MNIFEWNESIPVSANNLNEMQNIINNNIKSDYSTDEIKTNNKWVDNKPIYRKCISISNISTFSRINLGISNLSNVINIGGWITNTYGKFSLPAIMDDTHIISTYVFYYNYQWVAGIYCKNMNISSGYLIVEYTKTTD